MEKIKSKISIRIQDIEKIEIKGKTYIIQLNFDGAELRVASSKKHYELEKKYRELEIEYNKLFIKNKQLINTIEQMQH